MQPMAPDGEHELPRSVRHALELADDITAAVDELTAPARDLAERISAATTRIGHKARKLSTWVRERTRRATEIVRHANRLAETIPGPATQRACGRHPAAAVALATRVGARVARALAAALAGVQARRRSERPEARVSVIAEVAADRPPSPVEAWVAPDTPTREARTRLCPVRGPDPCTLLACA